jgi:fructose/tagatose bisphosphate aldolase
MTTLLEVLQDADARRIAVGHFNVSDLVTLYGVVEAGRQQELPVVVGRRIGRPPMAVGLPATSVRAIGMTSTDRGKVPRVVISFVESTIVPACCRGVCIHCTRNSG